MPFAINGQPIQSARLTVPRREVWEGEVAVAGPLELPAGAPVALLLGDTTFQGFVVAGGTFLGGGESTYTIAGGSAGWSRKVLPRIYSVPAGVHLAVVAAQLAADAGERLDLGGFDLVLGDHWVRPASTASVALSALIPDELGWRVDPDGVTRIGPRPPAAVPPALPLTVEDYEAGQRWARVALPGDNVSALLPGAILAAPNLAAPILVRETTIRASSDSVTVEVLGEQGLAEMLAALVHALTTQARIFNGEWLYQVVDDATGRANLAAVSIVAGLPPVLAADKIPGIPGATSTLAPGALVALGFIAGDPGRPFVSRYLGGVLPVSVVLDAATTISLGAGGTPLAIASRADARDAALLDGINTALVALSLPPIALPASSAAAKALGV